jgi:hypothetical protein
VHRGPITKQGSRLVRWAAVEAVQGIPADTGWLVAARSGLAVRRGRNIATVAVARRLLSLVYYGLRERMPAAIREPAPTPARPWHALTFHRCSAVVPPPLQSASSEMSVGGGKLGA